MAFELSFEQEEFLRCCGFDPDAPGLPKQAAKFLGERAQAARNESEREFYEGILTHLCRCVESSYSDKVRSFPERRRRILRPWMRFEQALLMKMAGADPDGEDVPESVFDILDDGAMYGPSAEERALCADLADALRREKAHRRTAERTADALAAAARLREASGSRRKE